MENLTPQEGAGGCAFACHQASTNNGDTVGNPCADGTSPNLKTNMQSGGNAYCDTSRHGAQIDNYRLARNHSITLKLDVLNSAISTLMSTAQTTSNSTPYTPPPAYKFSISSMDLPWADRFHQPDVADRATSPAGLPPRRISG